MADARKVYVGLLDGLMTRLKIQMNIRADGDLIERINRAYREGLLYKNHAPRVKLPDKVPYKILYDNFVFLANYNIYDDPNLLFSFGIIPVGRITRNQEEYNASEDPNSETVQTEFFKGRDIKEFMRNHPELRIKVAKQV